MSKKEEVAQAQAMQEEEMRRTPIPRGRQVLGLCEQRVGGSRMKVRCMDGKNRICRIPGRLKRKLWVREGDILLIEPWELGGDGKADIVYKYRSKAEVEFLRRKGLLKSIEAEF